MQERASGAQRGGITGSILLLLLQGQNTAIKEETCSINRTAHTQTLFYFLATAFWESLIHNIMAAGDASSVSSSALPPHQEIKLPSLTMK